MNRAAAILLPGNMCDARLWGGGGELLRTALSERSIVSTDADLTRDASIAAMATRALGAVEGSVLAIGFSMGAIVAVEMAAQAPERIAGLVLAGYNATADLPERAAIRPLQQAEVRAGGLERVLVEELKPNYLAKCSRNDRSLLTLLRAMGMELGAEVFVRQSEALRLRKDRRPVLRKLTIPVLYMCGLEDGLCPPDWHRQWATMTRGARLAMVAGAGHMLPLEQPRAFAEAIGQWLDQHREELQG